MKIPLLPENFGKRSLNYLGTLERVTTMVVLYTISILDKSKSEIAMFPAPDFGCPVLGPPTVLTFY